MDTKSKAEFLKKRLVDELKTLEVGSVGLWGLMNAQQMVEHLAAAFRNMYGLENKQVISPGENLPRMKEFLMSEKEFKPGTRNPGMSDTPMPARYATMDESIADLSQAIESFFSVYEKDPGALLVNPIFGELNFEEYIQLLHKHALHHLRQFNKA